MKILLALLLLMGITSSSHSQSLNKTIDSTLLELEQDVVLHTSSGDINGTLLLPANQDKPSPVVLIIAGSGPTDRNGNNPFMVNNSLLLLAQELAKEGIGSLRYDKRGIAGSKDAAKSENEMRFDDFISDAKGWINYIDSLGYPVIVAGHSQGSLVGMVAAQNTNAKKYISLAGAGRPIGDVLKEQLASKPDFFRDSCYHIIDNLEKGITMDTVSPYVYSLFRPSVQPFLISWMKYIPTKEIKKLKIPALIVQGDRDIQVKVEDAEALHKADKHSKLAIIKDMNHIFRYSTNDETANIGTYSTPELPIDEKMVDAIVKFIREK